MALLNNIKKYIKIFPTGEYHIYKSKEDRDLVKNSTSKDIILNKYEELQNEYYNILSNYLQSHNIMEEDFKDKVKWDNLLNSNLELKTLVNKCEELNREYYFYSLAISNNDRDSYSYPIMEEFYPDVQYSIPNIIESGVLYFEGESQEDMYNEAKLKKRFGDTADI